MFEVNFLFGMAVIWIVFAAIEDLRTNEIANWLNISLVVFAMGFRFFYSLFELGSFSFFYQGLIGLGIFVLLGNLFYYGRMFAGGDAKLMMALGAILPISNNLFVNLQVFFMFITIFLFVGAIYGIIVSVVFGFLNFKRLRKEFNMQLKKKKRFTIISILVSLIFLTLGFWVIEFFYLGLFTFIFPYFYLYIKSIDESCMVKNISSKKLTVGDWLYKNVKIGKKTVKATWDGLTESEIKLLQKKKKVLVRYGVQFAPAFLISFILMWIVLEFDWVRILSLFGL